MNLKKLAVCALLVMPASVSADMLYGVYAEAGVKKSTSDASMYYKNELNGFSYTDVEEETMFLSLKLEHMLPFVPNLRLTQSNYSSDVPVVTAGFEFGGQTYGAALDADVEIQESGATLYYEILDNWISLDVGLSVKDLDVTLGFDDGVGDFTSKNFSAYIPALYASAEFAIPTTDIIIGAQLEGLKFQDHEYTVMDAYVGYEFLDMTVVDFTVKLGAQKKTLKIDDVSDFSVNYDEESLYASLQVHF